MIVQLKHLGIIIRRFTQSNLRLISTTATINCRSNSGKISKKKSIDISLIPELDERDLVEQFVHGYGPGGQNVNKLFNCVVLKHRPTGITVKCHESRMLHQNQKLARERMKIKLDIAINGDDSVAAQQKRLDDEKSREHRRRSIRRLEMKRAFKERENIH